MSTIAVIKSTNHPQGDAVFRGAFGSISGGTVENDPATEPAGQRFTVDPDLRPVSSVFMTLGAAGSPVSASEYQMINVPDVDAVRVKDQLMLALQLRWRSMYKDVAAGAGQFVSAMLQAESSMVEQGINGYFERGKKTLWDVPVVARMTTGSDGAYLTSEVELLKALALMPARETYVTKDAIATPHQETEAVAAETLPAVLPDPEAQTPSWGDYMGIDAEVRGHVVVVAQNAQDAVMAAQAIVALRSQGEMFSARVLPTEVISTRPLVMSDAVQDALNESGEMDRDDDQDDDGEGNFRDAYRF